MAPSIALRIALVFDLVGSTLGSSNTLGMRWNRRQSNFVVIAAGGAEGGKLLFRPSPQLELLLSHV